MFGCYWKLSQTENIFSVDCKIRATGRKIFFVVIFTSNHFQRRAKRERGRERRTHKCANRERERERERDRVIEPTITPVKSPSLSPPHDGECSVYLSTTEIAHQLHSTGEIDPHPRAPIPPPWVLIHMTHPCPISLFLDLPLPFPHLSITVSSSSPFDRVFGVNKYFVLIFVWFCSDFCLF